MFWISLLILLPLIDNTNPPIENATLVTADYKETLNRRYPGGSNGFLEFFYQRVRYPAAARKACRQGQLKTQMIIDEKGKVQSITFLNHLGEGLEEEVKQLLEKTQGNWLEGQQTDTLNFKVEFRLQEEEPPLGDLVITAFAVNHTYACGTTKEVYDEAMKAIKAEKLKKAEKYCEELLRRQPDNETYKNIYTLIEQKLKE